MSKNHEKHAEKHSKKTEPCKGEELKNGSSAEKDEQCGDDCKRKDASSSEVHREVHTSSRTEDGEKTKSENVEAFELSAKLAELETKCKDWQDQYLRKAADFDNYRKRMIREKQEAIDYANTNLLLDLIQVLDDFDRAIDAGKASLNGDKVQKADGSGNAFLEGVMMIKNQMTSMLSSKYGLLYYPAKGEKFDPNIHEAVSMIQSPDVKEAVVGEELQKGYKLKERVIRSSKVMVLMPAEGQDKTAEENSTVDKQNEQ
ncbi:nucleotide exchange factor GrpE [Treponema pedis]|uniref:nucleotide exchange factor GrpE n=1 Tax=Treponema pedis TaxID=409322 RepID=UPI00041576CE|nr:nucleotide exchange factor GrpE [Treponema pedis]